MNLARLKKHWRLLLLLVVVVGVVGLRGPLLRAAGRVLIVDEDCPRVDCIWIGGGEGRFDHAAGLYHERPSRQILLVEPFPERLVRSGVLPSREATSRRELSRRGVPAGAIFVIPGRAQNAWEEAHAVAAWLADRPALSVLLLSDQFQSRRRRYVIDAVMDRRVAERISVVALPDRRFDANDWWQHRDGIKCVSYAALRLLYAWWCGAPTEPAETWTPEAYERSLRQALAETPP